MARASAILTSTRQNAPHFPSISGLPVNLLSYASRQRESICDSHGLTNAPGDNNCFLNSAVQIFWHLDVFRRSFRTLNHHVCLDNACIFCGIKMLFQQFQEAVGSPLAPDLLRQALASTFEDEQRFQLGRHSDAAECFENILLRLHYHIEGTSDSALCLDPRCIPHRKFAMDLLETLTCSDCRYTSDSITFTQMVHYVTVDELLLKSAEMQQRGTKSLTGLFGKIVRKANESTGDQRACRQCTSRNMVIKRCLTNRPDLVTIGLAWCVKPKTQTISDVLGVIDTNICLCHLYHASETEWTSSAIHHLVGMICFYGRHYVAFFYHSRCQTWMHFDDASVKVIGPDFAQVRAKCIKGNMQPLLLFYANPEFEPVPGDSHHHTALSDTSSCQSIRSHADNRERIHAPLLPKRSAPPRPPLRTVSCAPPGYQTQKQMSVPVPAQDRGIPVNTITEACDSRVRNSGGHCSRQNSRASAASSGIASVDSFDLTLDHFRVPHEYPACYRSSIESSARDETDSGCPSGEHTSDASTNSSIEIPVHYPRETRPDKPLRMDKNYCVQMLLRADDLISSGTLKEEKADLAGAIKLFDQAVGLLRGLRDAEPLTSCPQLGQTVALKLSESITRLHALHERTGVQRLNTSTRGSHEAPCPTNRLQSLMTLPRRSGATYMAPPHSSSYRHKDSTLKPEVVTAAATSDDVLERMHKSRRKVIAKNALGSRENNRSMPDLSLSREKKMLASHSTMLATFQSTTNSAVMCARSAVRGTLLNELAARLHRRANTVEQTARDSESEEDGEEFPPPPPELLDPEFDNVLDSGENDPPLLGTSNISGVYPCTLCGKRKVTNREYCSVCQIYLTRFGGAV